MENLNKENFWNELMQQFPEEMNIFCQWVDEYKKRIGWGDLFRKPITPPHEEVRINEMWMAISDIRDDDPDKQHAWNEAKATEEKIRAKYSSIKYHDLPIAMQFGMFLQFVVETPARFGITVNVVPDGIADFEKIGEIIRGYFTHNHKAKL